MVASLREVWEEVAPSSHEENKDANKIFPVRLGLTTKRSDIYIRAGSASVL